MKTVEERFRACITKHAMTVGHDAGLYRSVMFKQPDTYNNHFRITTWPGHLAISGDAGCYVFARLEDMFQFFRGDAINPSYWAEKLQAADRSSGYREFSEGAFRDCIKSDFDGWGLDGDERDKAWTALQESDLGDDEQPESVEDAIRRAMNYKCPVTNHTFGDFWDHNLMDFTYRFLWCCHAIQWAIQQYDAARAPISLALTSKDSR